MQLLRLPRKRKVTRVTDLVSFTRSRRMKLIKFQCESIFLVPSENKRDMRTIEDVQADLQAKKKMKLSQATTSTIHNP